MAAPAEAAPTAAAPDEAAPAAEEAECKSPHLLEELFLGCVKVETAVEVKVVEDRWLELLTEGAPQVVHSDVLVREPSAAFECSPPQLPPGPRTGCQV